MGEITPNAFIGQANSPAGDELSSALGSATPVWEKLVADLAAEQGVTLQEWKCYSRKGGWSLRLLRGKRTIVWLSPCQGCFQVTFILGPKAVIAAHESDLSARILKQIDESDKYPEGTGVRFAIRDSEELPVLKKLAAIKIAN